LQKFLILEGIKLLRCVQLSDVQHNSSMLLYAMIKNSTIEIQVPNAIYFSIPVT